MKILMYNKDPGGLQNYSESLVSAMKKQGLNVILSDKIGNYDFDVIHIQFEHMVFHPFGLKLIPLLIKMKIKGKKIVATNHTVLYKKEIYARNQLFLFVKKILFPISEKLRAFLVDKSIVHTDYAKKILIKDYKIPANKVEVIPIGIY